MNNASSSRKEVRFDGLVAIVTGGGGGLGRAYSLLLASRGCAVLVNDLGTTLKGGDSFSPSGKAMNPADKVVAEIRAAGGTAEANHDSVLDGPSIVADCVSRFGGVDIVINNAGFLRDVSFAKMTDDDWSAVVAVHLGGARSVTHAAWPHLVRSGRGAVVMATSAAGLYGNFGQANYAAAKLALVGLAQTLALEGRKHGVRVNAVAPVAASRMTATVLGAEQLAALGPEHVAPVVAWLCHPDCPVTGETFETGAGWCARVRWERSRGLFFRTALGSNLEDVRDGWRAVEDASAGTTYPKSPADAFSSIQRSVQQASGRRRTVVPTDAAAKQNKMEMKNNINDNEADQQQQQQQPGRNNGDGGGGNPPFSSNGSDSAAAADINDETVTAYTERDVCLYALGVGAGAAAAALPPAPAEATARELSHVYELPRRGGRGPHSRFTPLPTFAVTFVHGALASAGTGGVFADGTNPMTILHGEHRLDLAEPGAVPPHAKVRTVTRVRSVRDTGPHRTAVLESVSTDAVTGREICTNTVRLIARGGANASDGNGAGNSGGHAAVVVARGPEEMPLRAPDAVVEEATRPEQALVYRLSGDFNPLHADPDMAALGGFRAPILHGLCTFGIAARAVQSSFGSETLAISSISGRFSHHVYPGDTLRIEMWKRRREAQHGDGLVIMFRVVEAASERIVLKMGEAELKVRVAEADPPAARARL